MIQVKKPQSPLQHKDGDYFYPVTIIDQVLLEDGVGRLSAANLITATLDEENEGQPTVVNAQQLGGLSAENYVKYTDDVLEVKPLPLAVEYGGHGANNIEEARINLGITPEFFGSLSGFAESVDYPGCYYHEIDGVEEWINPPMKAGVEYRTIERFQNKPVFIKYINYGSLPAEGEEKTVSTGLAKTYKVRELTMLIGDGTYYSFIPDGGDHYSFWLGTNLTKAHFSTSTDLTGNTGTLIIKYIK